MNIDSIKSVNIGPDDVLFIKLPEGSTRQQMYNFQMALHKVIGTNKMKQVIVHAGEFEFTKLTMEIKNG